jgi:hypothetical protein
LKNTPQPTYAIFIARITAWSRFGNKLRLTNNFENIRRRDDWGQSYSEYGGDDEQEDSLSTKNTIFATFSVNRTPSAVYITPKHAKCNFNWALHPSTSPIIS